MQAEAAMSNQLVPVATVPATTSSPGEKARAVVRFLSRWTESIVGVVNGISGDYLENMDSHLAMPMALYNGDRPLELTSRAIAAAHPNAGDALCIMVHGLCCTERMWNFPGQPGVNYGSLLKKDLGLTPFYVRYNSGLHISKNGKRLARVIQKLVEIYPRKVKKIILLGHSQGGLVIQAACKRAKDKAHDWLDKVGRVILLGTPQLGAPLEKVANAFTVGLSASGWEPAQLVADFLNHRSAAIKDLRFGYVADEEWRGKNPDSLLQNHRGMRPVLEPGMEAAAAACLTQNPGHVVSWMIGDIMVRVPSAAGWARMSRQPTENFCLFPGMTHFALARDPKVYGQIKKWCQ